MSVDAERKFDRRSALLIAMVGAATVFGTAGAAVSGTRQLPVVATIDSEQLAKKLQHKDFFFVNVHTPYEGEIAQTDAFIVFDKISENLSRLPKDKNEQIVLYCRSGRMSEVAARELMSLGYAHVSHLSGGMIDWKRSGHEVIEK